MPRFEIGGRRKGSGVIGISGLTGAQAASMLFSFFESLSPHAYAGKTAWLLMGPCACRGPDEVTARVDRLIKEIRDKCHAPVIGKPKSEVQCGDVLIVAHGHILRAFAMRWAGKTLQDGPAFLLEAGGIGTLA